LTYLSRLRITCVMKPGSVRTSIDLPCELHRRIHEAAARKGCSARKLILEALRYCLNNPKWRLSLQTHKFVGIR
jgi:metal-responsive CopG/Arc/MetJ family transcriptional regulator